MLKRLFVALGLAAFVFAQGPGNPDNQNPQLSQAVGSVTMQLVGNSGQIKLFPSSESNRFIRIKMSRLQELDASGQVVTGDKNSINFASLAQGNKCANGAGWSALEMKTSSSGKTFYTSTFTCSAIPQSDSNTVTFKLRVDLYSDADNVQYGNKTVTVYKNTVKFSAAVTNWLFNAGGNQLRYTIFMASQGKGGSAVSGLDTSGANAQCTPVNGKPCADGRRIKFENSFLDFPSVALAGPGCSIDTPSGSPTCVEVPVNPVLSSAEGGQSVSVTLPSGCSGAASCTSSNLYDPVVDATNSSSFIAANLALIIAAFMAIVL